MSREMFSGNLRNRLHSDEWLIWQDQYEAKENLKYESLFALSNGYLGIRGSHEEGTKITLPYLYINGVFDKSETFMRELSTLPNLSLIHIWTCDGKWSWRIKSIPGYVSQVQTSSGWISLGVV